MTQKVTTDIQLLPARRLKQQFTGTKASLNVHPNSLSTSDHSLGQAGPNRGHAMGVSPESGIVSFLHDGAAQDFTVFVWHEGRKFVDATKGWVEVAESTALSTKNCRPEAICTFKIASFVPFFIQPLTSATNNFWVSAAPDKANAKNTFGD